MDDMLKIEEQSKSHSNSFPVEEPSSTSGTYLPSLVEKAKNIQNIDVKPAE